MIFKIYSMIVGDYFLLVFGNAGLNVYIFTQFLHCSYSVWSPSDFWTFWKSWKQEKFSFCELWIWIIKVYKRISELWLYFLAF